MSEKGYTLSEVLLVLLVISVLIGITSSAVPVYKETRVMEGFLRQFSRDFHYAQMYAQNHQNLTFFIIDGERKKYYVTEGTDLILTRNIPAGIEATSGTLKWRIYFTKLGHISNSGTWIFRGKHTIYGFTVMLGRGRHYYYEQ